MTPPHNPYAEQRVDHMPRQVVRLRIFTLLSWAAYLLHLIQLVVLEMGIFEISTLDRKAASLTEMVVVGIGIVGVIVSGIYALVFFGIRADRNWARVVGIICAVLWIGWAGFWIIYRTTSTGQMALSTVMHTILYVVPLVITVGINVYWIVLAYQNAVVSWFTRR